MGSTPEIPAPEVLEIDQPLASWVAGVGGCRADAYASGPGLARAVLLRPSWSMEPTPEPADRILAKKIGVVSSLQRGDRVVFDGARTFADRAAGAGFEQGSAIGRVWGAMTSMVCVNLNESQCAKRVVGLPGDHVVCCEGNGLLTVNDIAVQEPFLYPGDKPSDPGFDVTVPPEHVWVMGDHRSDSADSADSADSRARLGDPGGGMVRLDDVIGRAVTVSWPPSRARLLHAPGSLRVMQARTAGKGHR